MSFSALAFFGCLIAGPLAIYVGTRKPRNRRRQGVLPKPSPASTRAYTPEAAGKVWP
jgi:hypothetical protein